MSVYSGFATRQQETIYDKICEKGFQLLQDKILKSYNPTGKPHSLVIVQCSSTRWVSLGRSSRSTRP